MIFVEDINIFSIFAARKNKKLRIMCIFNDFRNFISNGANVFRSAARGEYSGESDAVKALRKEMMERPSSLHADKENLYGDRMNVAADVRRSFNQLVLG